MTADRDALAERMSIVIPVSSDNEPPASESLIDVASAVALKRGKVLVGRIHYDGEVDSPDSLKFDDLTFHSYSVDTVEREG